MLITVIIPYKSYKHSTSLSWDITLTKIDGRTTWKHNASATQWRGIQSVSFEEQDASSPSPGLTKCIYFFIIHTKCACSVHCVCSVCIQPCSLPKIEHFPNWISYSCVEHIDCLDESPNKNLLVYFGTAHASSSNLKPSLASVRSIKTKLSESPFLELSR